MKIEYRGGGEYFSVHQIDAVALKIIEIALDLLAGADGQYYESIPRDAARLSAQLKAALHDQGEKRVSAWSVDLKVAVVVEKTDNWPDDLKWFIERIEQAGDGTRQDVIVRLVRDHLEKAMAEFERTPPGRALRSWDVV